MKKALLLLFLASLTYARPYLYDYSCNSLYDDYKESYSKISQNNYFMYDYYCKELGKKLDRIEFSSPEEEMIANEEYLKHQQLTLGIACEQITKQIPVYYKKNYCELIQSNNVQKVQKTTRADVSKVELKQIAPSVQYKNTPQLKMKETHIYGINDIKLFRDKKDTVLIESSIGNFAVPIKDLKEAERINFTVELSHKLNTLIKE